MKLHNAGFEQYTPTFAPHGWSVNANGYAVAVDGDVYRTGHASLRVVAGDARSALTGASIVQHFPPVRSDCHTLVLKALVQTDAVSDGQASLWAMVRKDDDTVFFDTMESRGSSGTTDWHGLQLGVSIPPESDIVVFGALHSGTGTAWFDDFSASVNDTCRRPESDRPEEGIESGTQRADESGQAAAGVAPEVMRSLVRQLSGDPKVRDARILAIGEFSHGVHEINELYREAVQHLHSELGFSIVAFEHGFASCSRYLATERTEPTVDDLLRDCAGPQKQTESIRALMEYAVSSRLTPNPLQIIGIDSFISVINELEAIDSAIATVDSIDPSLVETLTAYGLFEWDGLETGFGIRVQNTQDQDVIVAALSKMIAAYRDDCIAERTARCRARSPLDAKVELQRLKNLSAHARHALLGFVSDEAKRLRDRTMADNVTFVASLFPEQKIILLAHNAHVRRKNEAVLELGRVHLQKGMGSAMSGLWGDDYAVAGVFAQSGSTREPVVGIVPIADYSATVSGFRDVGSVDAPLYLSVSSNDVKLAPGWPDQPLSFNESGSYVTFVPAIQYDAIIVFPTVSASRASTR